MPPSSLFYRGTVIGDKQCVVRTAYQCRAYPTDEQTANLVRTFGCVRKVWNEILDWRTKRYRVEGVRTNYAEADRCLTELKNRPDLAYLREVSSVPLQQTLRHQYRALTNFFARRARYPRYKSRNSRQSATYTKSAFRWRHGNLFLAKQSEPLRFVWSWPDIDPTTLEPSMVTVVFDSDGMWHVTVQTETAAPEPLPATGAVVGVDVGILSFAATSDGAGHSQPSPSGAQSPKPGPLPTQDGTQTARVEQPAQGEGESRQGVWEGPPGAGELPAQHQHRPCASLRHDRG